MTSESDVKRLAGEVNAKFKNPQILINMVSKRVRQLGQGFRPLIPVNPKMTFMDVALNPTTQAAGKQEVQCNKFLHREPQSF